MSKHIDTYYPEDDNVQDDEDSDDNGSHVQMTRSPSVSPYATPQHNQTAPIQSAAPSPEVLHGSPSECLHTPSRLPTMSHNIHSTRIPDFVQLLYKVNIKPDNTLDKYVKHIMLLVEIKRCVDIPSAASFVGMLPQTNQQACHTFSTSLRMQMLGVIIVIDAFWTCIEYDRDHIQSSPSMSEQKDATYMDKTPNLYESWMRECEPFTALVAENGFLHLQTPSSDHGLCIVRQWLQELTGIPTQP